MTWLLVSVGPDGARLPKLRSDSIQQVDAVIPFWQHAIRQRQKGRA